MKVALVQIDSRDDKACNLARSLSFVEEALLKKAAFVLLPEYFYFRGRISSAHELSQVVEPVDGSTVRAFGQLAQKHRAHILLGSIYEKSSTAGKAYNTSVLIGPNGHVAATYRKRNLFHIRLPEREICEAKIFKPGRVSPVVPVGKFKLGMAMCFDVRFPVLFEDMARQGANMFSIPASFSYKTGQAHWELLVRARAAETFSYCLAPNQTGINAEGALCWGHSMVVDPWGRILAEASQDKEEVVYAQVDLAEVQKIRRRFPNYKNLKG